MFFDQKRNLWGTSNRENPLVINVSCMMNLMYVNCYVIILVLTRFGHLSISVSLNFSKNNYAVDVEVIGISRVFKSMKKYIFLMIDTCLLDSFK
jgi:hypothetical protein